MKEYTETILSLHERVAVVDAPRPTLEYPCRQPNCNCIFRYKKARENHENKVHDLSFVVEHTQSTTEVENKSDDSNGDDM